MLFKRTITVCIATSLLVSSLVLEKIAKAADTDTTTKNYLESSDLGPMPSSSSGEAHSKGSSSLSQQKNDNSSATPTPEQLNKRQKIIVY
ncbi:hypothetical protein DQK91_00640 [Oceanidesulfovibrio marinus]|uniref:Uncharacterized protein n=1 Tax=Oceanidesulfovibrio marinus TaxID=370038 RepID=A0A6P1ZKZ2_9BACT|nr:hypothetical protein DQK91_00640 [Oceanidesulfovibrio marinus]